MTKDFENETPREIKEAEGQSIWPLELYSCLSEVRD